MLYARLYDYLLQCEKKLRDNGDKLALTMHNNSVIILMCSISNNPIFKAIPFVYFHFS